MKRIATLLASLCLMQSAHAQTITSAVPGYISYQGRALNSAGTVMGSGSPVNRTVTFRIWDHASNSLEANLIYSEQQVVTIAEGEFSVLVGSGAATAGTPLAYSETTKGPPTGKISDAFGGVNRYLGVTIDDGTAAVDNEISPRQQIVSGAFALRSKFAESSKFTESIGSATDLTLTPLSGNASNYGLGWYGTGRLFNSVAVDGPVLYGNSGGALGSNASGSQKLALSWDASGRVGIGATSITSGTNKLTLQGDMITTPADQLTIRGSADNTKRLLLGYDTTANKASLQSYTAASTTGPLLLNPSGGNVGVNKVDPAVALDVTGAIKASTSIAAGTGITAGAGGVISNGGIQSSNNIVAGTSITAGTRITAGGSIAATGNMTCASLAVADGFGVGIVMGTVPYGRLHVSGVYPFGANPSFAAVRYLTTTGVAASNVVHPAGNFLTAYFGGSIAASQFVAFSDERIKHVDRQSESAQDLKTLMGIEITDYSYIDKVARTATPQKKVIAQQVEKVFPQAVSRTTDVVPDIYQKASLKGAWISLESDLKVGDRVRLISEKLEGVFAVLEVSDGKFRTEFAAEADEVFVYGREVSDFRVVDYEAIAMLNVSATQQIKREKDAEIQTLRDENAALRRELAAKDASLEAKDASLEAKDASLAAKDAILETRLIALERRMAAKGSTKTVSLKTAQALK